MKKHISVFIILFAVIFCFVAVASSPTNYKTMYEKLLKDYNSLKTQYDKLKKENADLQAKVNELSKKAGTSPVYEYQRDIILNGVTLKYKVPFINYKGMRFVHLDSILYCFFNKNIAPWKINDNQKALIIGPDLGPNGGIFLTDLPLSAYKSVRNSWGDQGRYGINQDVVTLLGKTYRKNIWWDAYQYSYWQSDDNRRLTFVQYILNGDYKKLKMTLGLDDDSEVGASGKFTIYLDGEKRYEIEIAKGEKGKDVSLDVVGCNTLKIEFFANPANYNCMIYPFVGDAVLYK
ncbi:hypothetical protein COB47_0667 [Caldicellulosiruptor obsidiansis OB47]|uniref:Glycosyl hydrolase family 98 putative carbohydrate-binding module domain-containing protein n=1 Tax=Caldicellulosiruptor obsidiansis (strain ATCC BAA-2073 / JCM 16842 / OB47) TaxID=608506 RepID=D9TIZ8_CALOO|nr:NPCBM/NEW2 domain-containing protein [Caldicellulosiruptor obsidiansis]ADL41980.1 hypothetical protein COB47_0667 [Caldicellulosiruptor obsidiansis OB47]